MRPESSRAICVIGACLILRLLGAESRAASPIIESLPLPALRIDGRPARAHTQGLEMHSGQWYVTARRDDVMPRHALLLRTDARRLAWDVWNITPIDTRGDPTKLDHPGGIQSDGTRLWIPTAESNRKGRSLVRAFPLRDMTPGQALKADVEFSVDDHIGAVAVAADQKSLFGASWDTETVYVWDFEGRLQRTFTGIELQNRELGVINGANGRAGLAVQDWKFAGNRLFASGLFRGPGVATNSPQSRIVRFSDFSKSGFQRWSLRLPKQQGMELAREGMAVAEGWIHFLPGDLGATNWLFRLPLDGLLEASKSSAP